MLSWHPGVLAILGYEEADFVGRSVEFIFTEEDRAAGVPAAELRQAEEAGRAVDERWHRRADGSRFWASGVLSALRSDGSLIGFVKILRDATERKRAEQALADSEQKFAKAFELAPLILAITSLKTGRLLEVNDAFVAATGYSRNEAVGRSALELNLWVDPAEQAAGAAQLARGEVVLNREVRFRYRSGAERSCLISAQTLHIGGEPCVVNALIDVTERKRAEEQLSFLAEASHMLNTSLELDLTLQRLAEMVVPRLADWCVISLVDLDGSIRPAALAHKDPEQGQWAWDLRTRYPTDPDARWGTTNVIRTGETELYETIPDDLLEGAARNEEELELLRKVRYRSVLIVPLKTRGRVLGALSLVWSETSRHYDAVDRSFAEDLAQRAAVAIDNAGLYEEARSARRELEILNHELEAKVEARNRQVRSLAGQLTLVEASERARLARLLHDDLQQQLFAPQFALKRLQNRLGIDEAALAALAEANSLVKEAVLTARATTSTLAPPVLHGEGLVEALRWLATHMRERHGLNVTLTAAANLKVPAEALRVLLFTLVRELLFNVTKHAEVSEAEVALREQAAHLEVEVADRGKGFDAARCEAAHATGLGLSGVRKRLELFEGRLDVVSKPGEGTRVTIVVPLASYTLDQGV